MYKNAWNILVINSALEEDAIQFYSTFADVLIFECLSFKSNSIMSSTTKSMCPLREIFSTVIAPYENPPKELPRPVLQNYLHCILFFAESSEVIQNYKMLDKSMNTVSYTHLTLPTICSV
eukprot:TRINITY_DN19174_c0_g1_i2.p1 TRINITY_DN19174_c0_g1~~TRINITY_DN19174_c0_g1_i2.p1  ORF type:complete len:120 (+),score=12.88 TRINITY_DN19174_c0_g1_i2:182-541(+)